MLHGVSARRDYSLNRRHIPQTRFEKLLRFCKKKFLVVSLEEICASGDPGQGNKPLIAITFDDGYLNNVTVALPLLEKYGLPATFFLCADPLLDREYLHAPDCRDILLHNSAFTEFHAGEITFIRHRHVLAENNSGIPFLPWLGKRDPADQRKIVQELVKKYISGTPAGRINRERCALIGREETAAIRHHPLISIGSHGMQHADLLSCDRETLTQELATSREILEKSYGNPVRFLAFPYGSWNPDVAEAALDAGFSRLFAAGEVEDKMQVHVYPRMGILSGASWPHIRWMLNRGFDRFGF